MSSYQELHSFLSKFLNLLHCGQSAKLVLECHQGQAYVNLHHALHLLPQEPRRYPQQHGPTVRRQGPSRQRRRVRRALARANAEAAKASDREAETATLKSSDVAVQATVSNAEKASQSCSAEEECSPPPHEPPEQVVAPSFCGRVGHQGSPQHCAAQVEPVRDVFCDDLEYSAGQAVPQSFGLQVDGCLDISSTSSPTPSSVSAAGIQQLLAGSWTGGITRDIKEEEKQKEEREQDLEYIENLIRTNLNYY